MSDEQVITVRTEATPNPNSLKYTLGRMLIPGGSANFPDAESAADRSPLASRLFQVEQVVGVFIGPDFFTITRRSEEDDWNEINQHLAPQLEAFLESGEPVLRGKAPAAAPEIEDTDADPATIEQIKTMLDEKVRPMVAMDGGDIIYRGFKEGVVYLELYGACSGCPSSTLTLKDGVETMLKQEVPSVQSVEAL